MDDNIVVCILDDKYVTLIDVSTDGKMVEDGVIIITDEDKKTSLTDVVKGV